MTLEALEVIRAIIVGGVIHYVRRSKLLHREVGEAKQSVEDPKHHQGLHCIRAQLWKADIHVQQHFPDEWVKGQVEPLNEIIPVDSDESKGGLVGLSDGLGSRNST